MDEKLRYILRTFETIQEFNSDRAGGSRTQILYRDIQLTEIIDNDR